MNRKINVTANQLLLEIGNYIIRLEKVVEVAKEFVDNCVPGLDDYGDFEKFADAIDMLDGVQREERQK